MEKLRLTLSFLVVALAASFTLSCGASSTATGRLQSITISPAAAAAPAPDGEVQFTATGHYNGAPSTVTPQPATWGACYQNAPTTEVSVASTGLAQCQAQSGPAVIYSVFAFDMTTCNVISACGGGCTIVGTAQLTCPTGP
jgi:hypothetical protein